MTKHMRSRRASFDTRPATRPCDNAGDLCRGRQRPKWRLNAQEYAVIPNDGANLLDVGQECVAGILRKRQLRPTSALALDAQQGTAPIYVYQSKLAHVPCAKPEAGQEKDDGAITETCRRGDGTGRDDTLNGRRADEPRQGGIPPSRRKGYGVDKFGTTRTAGREKSEICTQYRHRQPHRLVRAVHRLIQHDIANRESVVSAGVLAE
jgi:hypothetical protein